MRRRKFKIFVFGIIAALVGCCALPSCGPMHSYWGVEGDYYSDGYHHHKPPKPPKPPKHKKHKKHKHHHHDD